MNIGTVSKWNAEKWYGFIRPRISRHWRREIEEDEDEEEETA